MSNNNLKQVDVLVIGATVAACGAVCALEKRGYTTAILERGQMCAAEYADSLFTNGDTAAYVPTTADGADFCQELQESEILGGRGFSIPAVAPVITARMSESGTTLYAPASVVNITSGETKYTVTFFSMGSTYTVSCKTIIDTTSAFVSGLWFGTDKVKIHKAFGANVVGKLPQEVDGLLGNYPDEAFITVPVINGDYHQARESVIEKIMTMEDVKLAITPMTAADSIDSTGTKLCDTLIWLPSVGFGTVTAAYDAGCRAGNELAVDGSIADCCVPEIKSLDTYDVVVCGGGTAGSIAALTAGRKGLRVLVIEDGISLGGMGTVGVVLNYYHGIVGGIYEEIDQLSRELMQEWPVVPMGGVGNFTKQVALGRALKEAGVTVMYEATVIGVLQEDHRVHGVRLRTDDGIFEVTSRFVIDATAEAIVSIAAGARTMGGRDTDGEYQPYSNTHIIYRDSKKAAAHRRSDSGIVDPYDPADFGYAILESGSSSLSHLRQSYLTEDNRFLGTIARLGLREGRRIIGEETVYLEDILYDRASKQPVLWGYANLDHHGKDNCFEESLFRRWITVISMWGHMLTIPIPAGALIPAGFDGLLVAGRCLAVDHIIASAVRMKHDMQKSGEAAATIAYEAINRNCLAKDVPYEALRSSLLETRCISEETKIDIIRINRSENVSKHESLGGAQLWNDDAMWLHKELAGDLPGYAIWSASYHGKALRNKLAQWTLSDDKTLRDNAALALGLAGCNGVEYQEAIPVLLEMAAYRDGKMMKSGAAAFNYPYALAATVLLELLGVKEAIPVILPYITDVEYAKYMPFDKCEVIMRQEDLEFQFALQGFAALCGLYAKFPEERDVIARGVESRIFAPNFHLSVIAKQSNVLRFDFTEKVRKLWRECVEKNK